MVKGGCSQEVWSEVSLRELSRNVREATGYKFEDFADDAYYRVIE